MVRGQEHNSLNPPRGKRGGDVVKLFKRIVSNNFAADLHNGKEERIELCRIDSGLFCIFYRGNQQLRELVEGLLRSTEMGHTLRDESSLSNRNNFRVAVPVFVGDVRAERA